MQSSLPIEVQLWLLEHDFGEVKAMHLVGGGCINQGSQLVTT